MSPTIKQLGSFTSRGSGAQDDRSLAPSPKAESLSPPHSDLPHSERRMRPSSVSSAKERYHSLKASVSQYLGALGELIGSKVPARFQVVLMGRFHTSPMNVVPARGEFHIFAGRTFEAERPLKYFEAIVPHAAAGIFSLARETSSGRIEQSAGKEIGLIAHRVAREVAPEKFSMVQDISELLHAQARECYSYGVGFLLAQRLGVPGRIRCSAQEALERVASAHVGLHESPKGDEVLETKSHLAQLLELARSLAVTRMLQEVTLKNHASEVVADDLSRLLKALEEKCEVMRKLEDVVSQADLQAILAVLEESVRQGLGERLESYEKMRASIKSRFEISVPSEEALARGEPTAYQQLRAAGERFFKLLRPGDGYQKLLGRPLNAPTMGENLRRAAWNLLEAAFAAPAGKPIP